MVKISVLNDNKVNKSSIYFNLKFNATFLANGIGQCSSASTRIVIVHFVLKI